MTKPRCEAVKSSPNGLGTNITTTAAATLRLPARPVAGTLTAKPHRWCGIGIHISTSAMTERFGAGSAISGYFTDRWVGACTGTVNLSQSCLSCVEHAATDAGTARSVAGSFLKAARAPKVRRSAMAAVPKNPRQRRGLMTRLRRDPYQSSFRPAATALLVWCVENAPSYWTNPVSWPGKVVWLIAKLRPAPISAASRRTDARSH